MCNQTFAEQKQKATTAREGRCSFCGKTQTPLMAGHAVTICEECVHLCNQIIAEQQGA
ncbi:MAG: hypothetical protein JST89_13860 [Cyanobacteria bacterium SZAS-4]|nr:hypothetical protein [Cyanobacteria bacterium SZAS-4]